MNEVIVIERIIGIFYGVIGWAIIINPKYWYESIKEMRKNISVDLIAGIISLLFGAVIITVHNIWEPTPRIITTCIGWLALMKGCIFLTIPNYIFQLTDRFYGSASAMQFGGYMSFLLAIFILYFSF